MFNNINFSKISLKIKSKIKKINFLSCCKYIFLICMLFLIILPFYIIMVNSFKTINDIMANNLLSIPRQWTLQNYKDILDQKKWKFWLYVWNTIRVTLFSTVLGTLCCILTAFSLSILQFRSQRTILFLCMLSMMIASEVLIPANYRTVSEWGWIHSGKNNNRSFVFVDFSLIAPFLINMIHITLLIKTFKSLPKELYYAAKVDGISDWTYLWKILVPIAKPTIITTVIFRIVLSWNAYSWPELVGGQLLTNMAHKIFTSDPSGNAINIQMAIFALINIPLFFIFFIFKKYIVSGENCSGIKG